MGFYRIGDSLAGQPGVGLYNISQSDFENCCCGLIVESIKFELLDPSYDPFCLRAARGAAIRGCQIYSRDIEGATLLAVDYLAALDFIAIGDTVPGRPCGFCEGSTYQYFLTDADEMGNKFVIKFEVEDCSNAEDGLGIPPRDYLCTVTISKCSK